jgi:hypothetical protein
VAVIAVAFAVCAGGGVRAGSGPARRATEADVAIALVALSRCPGKLG